LLIAVDLALLVTVDLALLVAVDLRLCREQAGIGAMLTLTSQTI
jgi:hypothetical protein